MAFVDEMHGVRRRRAGAATAPRTCTASPTSRAAAPTAATAAPVAPSSSRSQRGPARPLLARRPPPPAGRRTAAPAAARTATAPSGKDLVIPVPDGTVVFDERRARRRPGGRGRARGRGPRRPRRPRATSPSPGPRNRVPRSAEPGEEGEERTLHVELRTVADVGLVGLPNAGQVDAAVARSRPRSRRSPNYPFTTLTPNLGVAGGDEDRFVVADIPGLVEGASEGRGLGHRFLRHIVRCRALVLVVDLSRGRRPRRTSRPLDGASWPPTTRRSPNDRRRRGRHEGRPGRRPGGGGRAAPRDALAVSADDRRGDRDAARAARPAREGGGGGRGPRATSRTWSCVPGRPRFAVTRDDAGRWHVTGRNVERWVAEADLNDERRRGRARATPEEGRGRAQARDRWAPATATRS